MFLTKLFSLGSEIDYSGMIIPDYKDLDLDMITFSRDDFNFGAITSESDFSYKSYSKISYALEKIFERTGIEQRNIDIDGKRKEYFIDSETGTGPLKPIYKKQHRLLSRSNFIDEYNGNFQMKIGHVHYMIEAIRNGLKNNTFFSLLDIMEEATLDILKFKYLYSVCKE